MPISTTTTCGKRYEGGQMVCDRCGFTWDRDDPDPPKCLTNQDKGNECLTKLKEGLKQ